MKHRHAIHGTIALPARPTWQAALLLASLLSLPFALLSIAEFALF